MATTMVVPSFPTLEASVALLLSSQDGRLSDLEREERAISQDECVIENPSPSAPPSPKEVGFRFRQSKSDRMKEFWREGEREELALSLCFFFSFVLFLFFLCFLVLLVVPDSEITRPPARCFEFATRGIVY